MTLEQRTRALLDLVEKHRAARCGELLTAAREKARALRSEAYRAARARLRESLAQERDRAARGIALAQAQLNTRLHRHRRRETGLLLQEAAARLPDGLARRWQDPPARARWAESILAHAGALLAGGPWEVSHAPGWPDAERERAMQALAPEIRGGIRFAADPAIRAGLRVRAGHNVVDGSAAGLLADRATIEARLLVHLEERPA
jgi:hypothetical protein